MGWKGGRRVSWAPTGAGSSGPGCRLAFPQRRDIPARHPSRRRRAPAPPRGRSPRPARARRPRRRGRPAPHPCGAPPASGCAGGRRSQNQRGDQTSSKVLGVRGYPALRGRESCVRLREGSDTPRIVRLSSTRALFSRSEHAVSAAIGKRRLRPLRHSTRSVPVGGPPLALARGPAGEMLLYAAGTGGRGSWRTEGNVQPFRRKSA